MLNRDRRMVLPGAQAWPDRGAELWQRRADPRGFRGGFLEALQIRTLWVKESNVSEQLGWFPRGWLGRSNDRRVTAPEKLQTKWREWWAWVDAMDFLPIV